MSNLIIRRDDCRFCGGTDLKLVLQLAPVPIVDAYLSAEHLNEDEKTYPLDIFLCHGCGHAQLRDILEPTVLYEDYIERHPSFLEQGGHFIVPLPEMQVI